MDRAIMRTTEPLLTIIEWPGANTASWRTNIPPPLTTTLSEVVMSYDRRKE
jgi:hypothetical protein